MRDRGTNLRAVDTRWRAVDDVVNNHRVHLRRTLGPIQSY
jgi:hypothetical protein